MRILCAWCNTVIGGRGAALSHGICRRCFADLFQPQFDFMQGIPRHSAERAPALRTVRRSRSRDTGERVLL